MADCSLKTAKLFDETKYKGVGCELVRNGRGISYGWCPQQLTAEQWQSAKRSLLSFPEGHAGIDCGNVCEGLFTLSPGRRQSPT